ncbi:19721_t:CDS:2, partial [Gigaspora margarita]
QHPNLFEIDKKLTNVLYKETLLKNNLGHLSLTLKDKIKNHDQKILNNIILNSNEKHLSPQETQALIVDYNNIKNKLTNAKRTIKWLNQKIIELSNSQNKSYAIAVAGLGSSISHYAMQSILTILGVTSQFSKPQYKPYHNFEQYIIWYFNGYVYFASLRKEDPSKLTLTKEELRELQIEGFIRHLCNDHKHEQQQLCNTKAIHKRNQNSARQYELEKNELIGFDFSQFKHQIIPENVVAVFNHANTIRVRNKGYDQLKYYYNKNKKSKLYTQFMAQIILDNLVVKVLELLVWEKKQIMGSFARMALL